MLDLSKRSYQLTIWHQPLSSQAQLWRSAKSNKPWRLILSWVRMGGWVQRDKSATKTFHFQNKSQTLKVSSCLKTFKTFRSCASGGAQVLPVCCEQHMVSVNDCYLSTKRPTFIWTDILWLSKTVFRDIEGYSKMQLSEWIFCRNFYLLSTYPLHHGLLDEVQSNSHWKWTNLETKVFKVYFA